MENVLRFSGRIRCMDEEKREAVDRAKEKAAESRKQLEDQLGDHRERVDKYKKYYNNNKGDLVDSLLINFQENKKPATAGIIVLAPLLITLFVMDWILDKVSKIPFIDVFNLTPYVFVNDVIKLVFIISFGAFLATIVGRFVRTEIGFEAEKLLDNIMEKIPFLGSIYEISKVTADTVFNGAEEFSDPVKLDFSGMMVTAYRTGNKGEDGREVLFVPTSPNVTTGFVVEVPEEDIIQTDDTPREALTRTLSAGFGDSGKREHKRSPVEEPDEE